MQAVFEATRDYLPTKLIDNHRCHGHLCIEREMFLCTRTSLMGVMTGDAALF